MKNYYPAKPYLLGIFFTLIFSASINAQVGINTTTPVGGSMLDITSTDKGMLVPRIVIDDLSTIFPVVGGSPESLLAYNTSAITEKGYYYWNGSKWVRLDGERDWKLVGNAGTTAGTNFIGTTDAQDVVIKANNIERARIGTTETVINEDSNDYDFRIESNTLTNALFVDGGNDAVGIGTSSPSNYSGVVIDRFSVVGEGTTTVVGPSTNWTPVSAFINQGDGVSLFAFNESTTNTGAAFESGVQGPGFGVRVLHLPTSGGGFAVYGSTNSGSAWAGYFNGPIGSTGGFYNVSDKRWKKNIQKLNKNESSLNKIMQLAPKSYQWRSDEFPGMNFSKEETSFGFIAQELKEIFPQLVTSKAIPDPTVPVKLNQSAKLVEGYYMVNYTGLIPVLTQAIQEQQEIIEGQNNRISELENAIIEINRKLNK